MKAIEVKPGIYWVGVLDWVVRDFHGYVTPHGTSYNNYLIMDHDITLVDSVKHDFADTGIENIKSLVDPSKIKNIIVNHIENDHMGSLKEFIDLMPDATLYITEKGKLGMERFFDISKWRIKTVKSGDELKIGNYTLMFLETPMMHWPDSMMTYVKEAKLLFSQDAFGQHYASTAIFDDKFVDNASQVELDDSIVDYYANILMPFGKLIKAKISQVQQMKLDIDIIAPDHGIIWRKDPKHVIEMYLDMANGKAEPSIKIIYDTMWHGTEEMTIPIMQGIIDEGVMCSVIKLRATPKSVAIKEFWKSRGCLIGSPTLNNEVYPSVAEFMTYIKGLKPENRIIGAFGCYGWSGGAVKWLYEEFHKMKVKIMEPGVEVMYKPGPADKEKCYQFGKRFASEMKNFHENFTLHS